MRDTAMRVLGGGALLGVGLGLLGGCEEPYDEGQAWAGNVGEVDPDAADWEEPLPNDADPNALPVTCPPQMSVFPVGADHNIGYDEPSCGSGTCETSCPDVNANSDWGFGGHHGVDVFAHHRAELVAVADGTVVRVGVVSDTSGLRVRLEDACGWEYYYGHLDQAVVSPGDNVKAGDLLGYMGATGTVSTHLHFNVSPDGDYSNDINPTDLLKATSSTACGGASPPGVDKDPAPPEPPPPPPPPPEGCGVLKAGDVLAPGQSISSCDGRFSLVAQDDGNLVLYQASGGYLWHAGTHGSTASGAVMQEDGNFVLYSTGGTALWHTNTHGSPGAHLALQDDGNLVVYLGAQALWNSGTCCH